MKKILMGILVLLLVSFVSVAFAQIIEDEVRTGSGKESTCTNLPECPYGVNMATCTCKLSPTEHTEPGTWTCNPPISCMNGWNYETCSCEQQQADPEPEPEPTGSTDVFANLPTLENFTLVESHGSADEIGLVFSPKGIKNVFLYIYLYNKNGLDILQTWCEGDEKICKAMGNGKDCTDNDTNTWCYVNEVAAPQPGTQPDVKERIL